MPRRVRTALAGASLAAVLMAVVWWLAHDVAVVRHADAEALGGFVALRRPALDRWTSAIAHLCNPVPYVIWAAVPILVALLRGRPRVAVMLAAVLLGANETTEVLKPLLGGARDPIPGFWSLGDATWPSGHATAAMTLALSAIICAPARRRPAVAAAMAAFSVAIVFSFLELGWHYPSDAVGGFLVAALWAQLGLAVLWTYEAHRVGDRALHARHSDRRPAPAVHAARPAFSVAQAFAPSALIITVALGAGGLLALLHPHQAIAYATGHLGFVVVAAVIAAAAFTLASALSLLMRGGGLRLGGPGPSAATGELATAGR